MINAVGIVGHGLIGGSIHRAIDARLPHVRVVAVDKGDSLAAIAGAELIILAAPVTENIRILAELSKHVAGDPLVTDTGSTKVTTVDAAADCLPRRLRFVGGHPIAGAATGGAAAARADLFEGRPWILTPTPYTAPGDVAVLRGFIESLGAAVHEMDPARHDRLLAYTSHLPQLTVSALMHVVGRTVGEEGLQFGGSGLRDTTRLASSPAPVWRDIVHSNRANINDALDSLIAVLEYLRDNGTDTAVIEVFEQAASWKQALGKHDAP